MGTANVDKAVFQNVAATQGPINLLPGQYGFTVHSGTWGGGSVSLQRQAADGVTWISVQSFTADGFAVVNVPGGVYQVAIVTATGVYADVAPVVSPAS